MIRAALGCTLGLLLGALISALVVPFVGVNGFSGTYIPIMLGYICSGAMGALVGTAAGQRDTRLRHALGGLSLAVLATYVLRSLPLPWLNLVWLDGTSGPTGELPVVVLPLLGMVLGGIFGAARDAAPASTSGL